MIEVKQAAEIAADYLKDLIPIASIIRLEEVDLDEQQQYWYVTLSYHTGFPSSREYKIFKISARDGNVKSMKIRPTR